MEFGSELLGEEVPSVSTPRKRLLIYWSPRLESSEKLILRHSWSIHNTFKGFILSMLARVRFIRQLVIELFWL
jgi:hypothetical protein